MFGRALGPAVLSHAARALIKWGESVWAMDVQDGRLVLRPAAYWDVQGGSDRQSWHYRLTLPGPDEYETIDRVPAGGVLHFVYAFDPSDPWRGKSPLSSAALSGRLSAEVMMMLGDEVSGPRGALLPTPTDGADPTMAKFKADIRGLRGKLALVESQNTGSFDNAGGKTVGNEWTPRRLGANPPQAAVNLATLASMEIASACGVPWPLISGDGDGTSQRESYRRLLHATVIPLSRLIAEELTAKLETEISLSFDLLMAADISGKARAYQSMVGGGMDPTKAAGLSGLMEAE